LITFLVFITSVRLRLARDLLALVVGNGRLLHDSQLDVLIDGLPADDGFIRVPLAAAVRLAGFVVPLALQLVSLSDARHLLFVCIGSAVAVGDTRANLGAARTDLCTFVGATLHRIRAYTATNRHSWQFDT